MMMMRLSGLISLPCFRPHSGFRCRRLPAILPRQYQDGLGGAARRGLFTSTAARAVLQASADNVGSTLSGNKLGSDNTINSNNTVNLFSMTLPAIDVSSLRIAREKFRILRDPFTFKCDVVPEGKEKAWLDNVMESMKDSLSDKEKAELNQILVCTSSMKRDIDDQLGVAAANEAKHAGRVWRFVMIQMKKAEGGKGTHVLITCYEVHFQPKASGGQAIDLHEHKAMRDWMIDEYGKRLADRPEVHLQLGQRVNSDESVQSAWQTESWHDRLKTTGRKWYFLLIHLILFWHQEDVLKTFSGAANEFIKAMSNRSGPLRALHGTLVNEGKSFLSLLGTRANGNHSEDFESNQPMANKCNQPKGTDGKCSMAHKSSQPDSNRPMANTNGHAQGTEDSTSNHPEGAKWKA